MVTATVTSKGQFVIPKEIRQKLNIKKGTQLFIEERNGDLVIRPITPEYLDRVAGILNTKGRLTKALLEERARDKEREA